MTTERRPQGERLTRSYQKLVASGR
jgi:hypothetical protein